MKFRGVVFVLIITNLLGCDTNPYSRRRITNPESDRLSALQKVELFQSNSETTTAAGQIATAKLYESQGMWNEAIIAVKEAIQEDPMNSYYHSLRANYAYQINDISTAYREALTAYQLGSKSLQQSVLLAKMAVTLSEFSIVNDIIDSLALIYPDDPEILFIAARKADNEKNLSLAASNYATVLKLAPQNQENIYFYSKLLLDNNAADSAQSILANTSKNKLSDRFLLLNAEVNYANQQYDSAVFYYKKVLANKPDTAIYSKVMAIYSLTNQGDSLINITENAISNFPNTKTYYLKAARLLDKKYRYGEAVEHYEALYKLDTLDSAVVAELNYVKRKIAYLQRKKEEQQILADSLAQNQPNTIL